MVFWAVSDSGPQEQAEFVRAWQRASLGYRATENNLFERQNKACVEQVIIRAAHAASVSKAGQVLQSSAARMSLSGEA